MSPGIIGHAARSDGCPSQAWRTGMCTGQVEHMVHITSTHSDSAPVVYIYTSGDITVVLCGITYLRSPDDIMLY